MCAVIKSNKHAFKKNRIKSPVPDGYCLHTGETTKVWSNKALCLQGLGEWVSEWWMSGWGKMGGMASEIGYSATLPSNTPLFITVDITTNPH